MGALRAGRQGADYLSDLRFGIAKQFRCFERCKRLLVIRNAPHHRTLAERCTDLGDHKIVKMPRVDGHVVGLGSEHRESSFPDGEFFAEVRHDADTVAILWRSEER